MKTLVTVILFMLSLSAFAQSSSIYSQPDLRREMWAAGKEKTILGHRITRVEGKNGTRGMTNIVYVSNRQALEFINNQATEKMWTEDKKQGYVETITPGGQIELYITRLTINSANLNMFTVIIQDSTRKEIFRKSLHDDIPSSVSGTHYWYNLALVDLPENLPTTFFAIVIDELGEKNSFKVIQ